MIGSASTRKMFSVIGTYNWRRVNTLFRIPKGTTKILIRAAIQSSGNEGGKVWFDDIQFYPTK